MIKIIHSDLLNETTGIIVHGCNAQGVMASGIAGSIREKYPQVYTDYRGSYNKHLLDGTKFLGTTVFTPISNQLFIASGITQQFYGRNPNVVYVDYDAIQQVFAEVSRLAIPLGLPVKFPMIGAGLGNGDFNIIKNIIEMELHDVSERTLFIKE